VAVPRSLVRLLARGVLGLLLPLLVAAPTGAQERGALEPLPPPLTHLRVGLGYLDLDGGGNGGMALELLLVESAPRWGPVGLAGGALATSLGQLYGWSGLRVPVHVGAATTLAGAVGVGLYARGQGKELGSPLEFRSSITVERQWSSMLRVSLTLYHLSNAGTGRRNPGVEGITLGWSLPLPGSFPVRGSGSRPPG
jgi:lipid A 3-O-deacylase